LSRKREAVSLAAKVVLHLTEKIAVGQVRWVTSLTCTFQYLVSLNCHAI